VHIHVEADITKGMYGDYDTFIGGEAVYYLRLYLKERRRGTEKIPPEKLTDSSPLIRSAVSREPRPITEKQVRLIVRNLYRRAGLLNSKMGRHYELRTHSLRKFFKTQLIAKGVPEPYVEYMMGHTLDVYHDIKSKGVEFLRAVYAAANLTIRPKPKQDIYDFIEELLKAKGYRVDRELLRRAILKPHRTRLTREQLEEERKHLIREAFIEMLRKDLLTGGNRTSR